MGVVDLVRRWRMREPVSGGFRVVGVTSVGGSDDTATPAQRARLLTAGQADGFGAELATALSRFHGVPVAITLAGRVYPPDLDQLPGLLTPADAARIKAAGRHHQPLAPAATRVPALTRGRFRAAPLG